LATGKNGAVVHAIAEVAATHDPSAFARAGISMDDTSFIHQLDPRIAAPFQIGFSNAITSVMLIAAVIAFIGLVVIFFLPSLPLKETSGLQAMADEAAAAGDGGGAEASLVPARTRAVRTARSE